MKSKTIKNLVIGSIVFLGVSYVVETYVKNKKREKMIEQSKKNEETDDVVNERNYILISDVYKNVVNGEYNDFGQPKRKYHTLKKYTNSEE